MVKVNELALFAGAGGGILGARLLGWRTVCAVELDPYCREVLLRRQEEGFLPPFPIWDDIRTFDGRPWRGRVDVVTAGFPCQPHSVAGKRLGESDKRDLWPDTERTVRQIRSQFILLENVPGIVSSGFVARVYGGLAESGYDQAGDCLPAWIVGALHPRDRLWVLADLNGTRQSDHQGECAATRTPRRLLACANCSQGRERHKWPTEPDVVRVVDGFPFGLERVRALGESQVPAMVRAAWELLSQ